LERLTPYALITPTTLLVIGLIIVPIVIVIGYSLMDNVIVDHNPHFVGLKNYWSILSSNNFWVAVRNTSIFTGGSVVVHLVLGMGFAMLLNTKLVSPVARTLYRVIYVLPWVFTASIVAVLWRLLLDPNGVINYLLQSTGIVHNAVTWLGGTSTALISVTAINIWGGYPFFMISLLAGLQRIPTDLYEAATVDGAKPVKQFLHVTLPQLRPIIFAMCLLDLLWTTQQFTLIWATTGGGPINYTEVLSTFTYRIAFNNYEFSLASASAVIVLIASVVVAVFYVRQLQRARES
jgi:multiple sugar transport system permease protein